MNYLKMDDEARSRCVDGWQKSMPYIVGILSVSMVITISMLSSAFHQIHTLEAWRKHDFASTLLRMNKTLGQLEAKAGPQGRQGVQGAQGAPGKDGAQGPPGPPGPKGENDSTCNGINFYGTNPILIVELKKNPINHSDWSHPNGTAGQEFKFRIECSKKCRGLYMQLNSKLGDVDMYGREGFFPTLT